MMRAFKALTEGEFDGAEALIEDGENDFKDLKETFKAEEPYNKALELIGCDLSQP